MSDRTARRPFRNRAARTPQTALDRRAVQDKPSLKLANKEGDAALSGEIINGYRCGVCSFRRNHSEGCDRQTCREYTFHEYPLSRDAGGSVQGEIAGGASYGPAVNPF